MISLQTLGDITKLSQLCDITLIIKWYHLVQLVISLSSKVISHNNQGDITSKARWYHILLINSKTAPHMFVFCYNHFQHFLSKIFFWASITHRSPYTLSGWRETHKADVAHANCSTYSRELEECLNKALKRDHTWRKRSKNANWKPVTGNGIRLLLFD